MVCPTDFISANMFGGLIAAGVLSNMDGAMGIAGWRWLFIVNGCISMAFAVSCIFIIPNFPQTTKWLTDEQKAYALWRLKNDADEDDDNKSTGIMQGLVLALKDWRLYIFILLQHLSILSQTFQYLFPSIVLTLGYGRIETLLLTVPVWFATWCAAILVTWSADRTSDRSIHIIVLLTISAIGNAIVGATTRVSLMFALFILLVQC